MMGQKWAQKIQLGRETTAGTAVAATSIWRGVGGMIKDDREVTMVEEQVGFVQNILRSYIGSIGGSLSMAATPATFEQLPHILEAGIKTVGTGAADGAGSGKIYDYVKGTTSIETLKTYTIETGDNQQAEEMEYSFVESFTLSAALSGFTAGVALVLTTLLGYGFSPSIAAFRRVLVSRDKKPPRYSSKRESATDTSA